MKEFNSISLFSNVGMGEILLNKIGCNIILANELNKDRCEIYKSIHKDSEMICGDIKSNIIKTNIYEFCENKNIDLIIATPPCQGMSSANAFKINNDPRNLLICHAMEVFNHIQPKYMLIENVKETQKTKIQANGTSLTIPEYIESQLPEGYFLNHQILDAQFYGTPHSRTRWIGLISKGKPWDFPVAFDAVRTCRDVLSNTNEFPSLENGEHSTIPWHFARKMSKETAEAFSHTPTGQTALDNALHFPKNRNGEKVRAYGSSYKRNWWDRPAYTITSENGNFASSNNIHPGNQLADGLYSDARVFSVRELLALSGAPTDLFDQFATLDENGNWQYSVKETLIREVIGEMFPPMFCSSIVSTIPELAMNSKTWSVADSQLPFLKNEPMSWGYDQFFNPQNPEVL